MDNGNMPTREELQQMIEKAQKDAEAALAKLTPEQRAEAELRAKKMIEDDAAAMRELVESASKLSFGAAPKAARECPHCLAPVGSGRVCEYCGSPLED